VGAELPAAVRLLRELVEYESPTGHSEGVRAVAERIGEELEAGGADVRFVGGHLVADLDGNGEPLLVLGHTDTVWPVGTLASLPFRVDDDRAYGPGALDMKGGLVVLAEALRETGPHRRALRVFLTADEEHGSPTAREPLREAARDVAAALVLEPPTPSGALKTARRGLRRFHLAVEGRAAHTGTDPESGASAIEELAHQVLRIKALRDAAPGISVNVGLVRGGRQDNVVPDHAEARIEIRVRNAAESTLVEEALRSLTPAVPGTRLRLEEEHGRPPLERSAGSAALFGKAYEHGRKLGLNLREATSGGGSDGNLVGALGVPVLDGLGAEGGGAHARGEHVRLSSIPLRARLLARLLEDPGV
jgi:glutamate carboxypeptidase